MKKMLVRVRAQQQVGRQAGRQAGFKFSQVGVSCLLAGRVEG